MDILAVQTLCLVGLFLSTLILTVLPFRVMGGPKQRGGGDSSSDSKTMLGKYENLISYANCLSGGVFLATFFVGLLPEVRQETLDMLNTSRLSTSIPVTEVIVLIGFFLAMFVEQLAINVKDLHHKTKKIPKKPHENVPQETCVHENGNGTVGVDSGNIEDDEDNNLNQLVAINNHHSSVLAQHDHTSHGHSHGVEALVLGGESTAGLRLGILLLSLGVHCLFEGMALGLQDEIHTLVNLFIGVWIHECLIALALGFSMVRARPNTCRMWQIALFFSSLIPVGQVIGVVIGSSQSWTSHVVSTILQGIAAGTFVQVTFLDIIPEGLGPVGSPNRLSKVALLFLGFIVITAVSLLVETFGSHHH